MFAQTVAPLKALCNEKYNDWSQKFKEFNVKCIELTGDSHIVDDIRNMQNANIICTTPVSETLSCALDDSAFTFANFKGEVRRDNSAASRQTLADQLNQAVSDRRGRSSLSLNTRPFRLQFASQTQIHVLGESRGATIEVIVSRMKTYDQQNRNNLRFIAISATIPNINDVSPFLLGFEAYLGLPLTPRSICRSPNGLAAEAQPPFSSNQLALARASTNVSEKKLDNRRIDESFRPIPIRKHVIGYHTSEKITDFLFDLRLSYKLADVIDAYSNGKPCLIFCSTRKSASQAAAILCDKREFYVSSMPNNKQMLVGFAQKIKDAELQSKYRWLSG